MVFHSRKLDIIHISIKNTSKHVSSHYSVSKHMDVIHYSSHFDKKKKITTRVITLLRSTILFHPKR